MSTLSQFISMTPIADTVAIGEIRSFPSINAQSTIIESNTYIRVGTVVSRNDFSELYSVLGSVEGSTFTRKQAISIRDTVFAFGRYYGLSSQGQVYTWPNTEAVLLSTGGNRSVNSIVQYGKAFYYTPNANVFIISGTSGEIHTSTDAVTWNTLTSGTTKLTQNILSVRYGNGLYVAITEQRRMATSTDLVNWETFPDTREVLQLSEVSFTTPGSYSWVAPPGVTSVNVVCIGAGNMTGGGLGWKNNIPVTPGVSYTVVVGSAGNKRNSPSSTDSYFINTSTVRGGAGQSVGGAGGTFTGDGGGNGGLSGTSWDRAGGGGAGGYLGSGGNGGSGSGNEAGSYFGTAGQGGGGGGGGGWNAGGGGGTGILGYDIALSGPSGAAGDGSTDGPQNGGGGGSGGSNGSSYSSGSGGFGGSYGGGGASVASGEWSSRGSSGAVRIVWGVGQSYPNNASPQNLEANNMTSVAVSSSGLFVTGGVNGIIKTSSDSGETWIGRTSGTSSRINALVFGNDLFVYAGENGILSTSTDGTTWTSRTSGTSNTISTLAYSNGVYIYGTLNGSVGRSTNGTTWTLYSSVISSRIFSSSAIPNLYVVGGEASRIATSTNGITWTARSNVTANIIIGSSEYLNSGIYTWVAPSGVTSVSVVCIGGGGGFVESYNYSNGWRRLQSGGGGGLAWKNNIQVTPGSSYTVNVGNGGLSISYTGDEWQAACTTNFLTTRGGNSFFNNVATVAGFGGGWNTWDASSNRVNTSEGVYFGDGGGRGGFGRDEINYGGDNANNRFSVSGGGAGGYNGEPGWNDPLGLNGKSGGYGGRFNQYSGVIQSINDPSPGFNTGAAPGGQSGRGGGGTGIWGKGLDGIYEQRGGSRGELSNPNSWASPGRFGGGASSWNTTGANGAVRIIWGPNRAFSNIANVEIVGNIVASNIQTDDFLSMTYGDGIFVVGSRSNKLFTSTDAITWNGTFGANNSVANDILCITYSSGLYYYGDSNGNIALSNNLSNWVSVSGNTLSHPINAISSIANTVIYVGNRGNIARIRNKNLGFHMFPTSPNISFYDLEFDWSSNKFLVVGNYNTIYRSEANSIFNWVPVKAYNYQTGGSLDFNYSTSSGNTFFRIFRDNDQRFTAYGQGSSQNGYSLVYRTDSGGPGVDGVWYYTSNTNFFYDIDRNFEYQYALYPYVIRHVDGFSNFLGSREGILMYGGTTSWGGTAYRLTGITGNIWTFGRTEDGKFFFSDGTYYYTANSSSGVQYSSFYDFNTQFYIPRVNIAVVNNYLSPPTLLPISSDFYTTSNTIYENVFIRAK